MPNHTGDAVPVLASCSQRVNKFRPVEQNLKTWFESGVRSPAGQKPRGSPVLYPTLTNRWPVVYRCFTTTRGTCYDPRSHRYYSHTDAANVGTVVLQIVANPWTYKSRISGLRSLVVHGPSRHRCAGIR